MNPLTASRVAVLCLALVAGCATPQTYKSPAGSGATTPIPDTTPQLGPPAGSLDGSGNSSSYGPADPGGPTLGLPEASRRNGKNAWRETAIPWPEPRTTRYRSDTTRVVPVASRNSLPPEPVWNRAYASGQRRPIETLQVGRGARRVALLASLHGDETQSARLVEELARHLVEHPESAQEATIMLVRCPNPDGAAAHSPYNARGVDLNRNFPSANWKTLPNGRAGAKAASEAETQAVARLLSEFRPTLVAHLKDSRGQTVINVEGLVRDRGDLLGRLLSCRVVEGLGAKTSGSLENYADSRLHCPSLTLLLAPEQQPATAWSTNRDALLSLTGANAVSGEKPALDETMLRDEPALRKSSLRQQAATDPEFSVRSSGARARQRGSFADFPAPIPDRGYVELPPP